MAGCSVRADTTPVMLYGVSGVTGLSEGDARVRLAAACVLTLRL